MEQSEFYRQLGERIRSIRSDSRKLTQEEFANRVNLSRPSIVNIEKGRQQISTYQLIVFAIALGITPAELLTFQSVEHTSEHMVLKTPVDIPAELRSWYSKAT